MDVEWLPNGGLKTILGPRNLTKVFEGRKGRRMWFNTVVGMHGKEISSATMAYGTEIPEHVVKRCGEIIEEEAFPSSQKSPGCYNQVISYYLVYCP